MEYVSGNNYFLENLHLQNNGFVPILHIGSVLIWSYCWTQAWGGMVRICFKEFLSLIFFWMATLGILISHIRLYTSVSLNKNHII